MALIFNQWQAKIGYNIHQLIMHHLLKRFLSHLPSSQGQDALRTLMYALSSGGIEFEVKRLPAGGGNNFSAESLSLPDRPIAVGAATVVELDQKLKDAIFESFRVPTYYRDYALLDSPLTLHSIQLRHSTPLIRIRVTCKNKNQPQI